MDCMSVGSFIPHNVCHAKLVNLGHIIEVLCMSPLKKPSDQLTQRNEKTLRPNAPKTIPFTQSVFNTLHQ